MLERMRKEFIRYAKTFDLKNPNIMRKFHHSFRVMEYSCEIAQSLKLSDEDIEIAMIIGLLHDISRFKQWTIYGTYNDHESFDHGDEAVKILDELNILNDNKVLIKKAIKNHNKAYIEDGLKERELLFTKIIRDADKIDIIKEQGTFLNKNYKDIDINIVNDFYDMKLTNNLCVKEDIDHIIRMISFVYDFNFKYSFDLMINENIIKNKFNLLINYCDNRKLIENMEDFLFNYMKERC